MKVLIILALLGATAMAQTVCPQIACADITTENVCFEKLDGNTNGANIEACANGEYCQIPSLDSLALLGSSIAGMSATYSCATVVDSDETNEEEDNTTTIKLLPGDICTAAADCYSGTCTDNLCVGLAADAECEVWSTATTDAEKEKLCGDGLYCNSASPAVCATGAADGEACAEDHECTGRLTCIADLCVDIGAQAAGAACDNDDLYCAEGHFCNSSNECAEATAYTATDADYRTTCTEDANCAPGDCNICLFNADGSGRCGQPDSTNFGPNYYNKRRTALTSATFKCPLEKPNAKTGLGACAGAATITDGDLYPKGTCYDGFTFGPDSTDTTTMGALFDVMNSNSVTYSDGTPTDGGDGDGTGTTDSATTMAVSAAAVAYLLF